MKTLRSWVLRLGGLVRKQSREAEMADELQSHLEMHIADNVRAGMTPEEARRAALMKLGGVEAAKEAIRERSTLPFLENLLSDFRFSLRQLRKSAVFAVTAVVVLALGMGVSVAIFAFVDAALIKPLPYPDPTRLMAVTESSPLLRSTNLSYLDYLDWKQYNTAFRSLDVYTSGGFLYTAPSGAEPVRAGKVSPGFFQTLGVAPHLGQDFPAAGDRAGETGTVMLSHRTWQMRFGGRNDVLGRPVTLSGEVYIVIGVLPASFQFAPLGAAEFWTTIAPKSSCVARRSCHNLYGVGRLKDGVTIQAALANLTAIASQLERQYPDSNRDRGASILPFSEEVARNLRPILMVLMGGAALLLLIAGVNVSSLVLARSEARKQEMAVRVALGASFSRLCTQFLTEGMVLVLAASALGLFLAASAMEALKNLIPLDMVPRMPFLAELGMSERVLAYAGAVSVLCIVLFSLAPALHLTLSAKAFCKCRAAS